MRGKVTSLETRKKKLSEAGKNIEKLSEAHKKIAISLFKRKKFLPKRLRKKISNTLKGYRQSSETKLKKEQKV